MQSTPSQGRSTPATGKWTVGTVPLTGSATLALTATVNAPGTVTNLAVKTAQTEPDQKTSNDSGGVTLTARTLGRHRVDKASIAAPRSSART